jgi:hypothetical protein
MLSEWLALCLLYQRGRTALVSACGNGHVDAARWLVAEAGSDAGSERTNVCGGAAFRCRGRDRCSDANNGML